MIWIIVFAAWAALAWLCWAIVAGGSKNNHDDEL